MKKEQRFKIRYISKKDGTEKVCIPRSEEAKNEQLKKAKDAGIKVISCTKLYPFSSLRNQHNFSFVADRTLNIMHDMLMGDVEYNEAEFEKLQKMHDRANELFCLEFPVAWLEWKDLKDAKELSMMAINWRIDTCERAGRYDLIQYCAL